jgi:hypothetical protein
MFKHICGHILKHFSDLVSTICEKAKCFGPESGYAKLTLQAHSGFNSEVLFWLPVVRIRICKFRKKTHKETSRIQIRIRYPVVGSADPDPYQNVTDPGHCWLPCRRRDR